MTKPRPAGRSWREVKRDAIAAGFTTQENLDSARTAAQAELRSYRLAEIRKQSAATQREIAEAMNISQGRVSQIESGNLDSSELGTLRGYVEALGGHVRVVADFGDISITIGE